MYYVLYIHVCKFSKIFLLPVTFKILHPQLTAGYVQLLWTSEQVYLVYVHAVDQDYWAADHLLVGWTLQETRGKQTKTN